MGETMQAAVSIVCCGFLLGSLCNVVGLVLGVTLMGSTRTEALHKETGNELGTARLIDKAQGRFPYCVTSNENLDYRKN